MSTAENPGIAMASGVNYDDCNYRFLNMTWQNFKDETSFPRVRDSNIGMWCTIQWGTDL